MIVMKIPLIAEKDDYTFRRIIHTDFPDTRKEWLDRQSNLVSEYRKQGIFTKAVEINPDEFSRFLDAMKSPHTLKSLEIFASDQPCAEKN